MSKKPTLTNRKSRKSSFDQSRSFDELKKIFPCNVDRRRSALYQFVYSSTYSLVIVTLLLVSFLLQGIESVYANEPELVEIAEEVTDVIEEDPVEDVETAVEEERVVEEGVTEDETMLTEVGTDEDLTVDEKEDLVDDVESADGVTEEDVGDITEDEVDKNESQTDMEANTEEESTGNETGTDIEDDTATSSADSGDEVVSEAEDKSGVASSSDLTTDVDTATTTNTTNDEVSSSTSAVTDKGTTTVEVSEGSGSTGETGTSTIASTTEDIVEESQDPAIEPNDDPSDKAEENQEMSDNKTESANDSDESSSSNDNNIGTGEEQATTTGEILGMASTSVPAVSYAYATHDNEYVFDKTACVAVGGGAYHCSTDAGELRAVNEQVFSDRGSNGNYEIFIRTGSGVEQITDNHYDDSSPKYDEGSKQLVWQRLIDGRYQIILYNLRDETEKQLTSGSQNHMEPAVAGSNIVWQEWDGNDWEIVLYDGRETKQLTDNDAQDLAPVIEDEYVVWTAVGKEEQLVYVYSLKSGTTQTITDHEGGAIANPRFVLVYDTKFDNGDIITKGFDPETGLSASLAAVPMPLPVDIPPPDSTGETRALIQNKPPQREDFSEIDLDNLKTADDGNNTTNTASVSTSTIDAEKTNDLVVTSTTTPTEVVSDTITLTEFDLIVDKIESEVTSTDKADVENRAPVNEAPTSTSTQSIDGDVD